MNWTNKYKKKEFFQKREMKEVIPQQKNEEKPKRTNKNGPQKENSTKD